MEDSYGELCLVVDRHRLSDNAILIRVAYEDKMFWVESSELCKQERENE